MGRKFKRLNRFQKFVGLWGLIICISFLSYFSSSDYAVLEEKSSQLLSYVYVLLVFFLVGAIFFVVRKRKENKLLENDNSFKSKPWKYDRKIVEIEGRVEKVFTSTLDKKFEIFYRELIAKLVGSNDPLGRHAHLRFLISSPFLKKGEMLLVSHNLSFNKIKLHKGQKVNLRGEYLHNRSKKKSAFGGKFTYYGLIHYTHDPKGWIKIL